MIVKIIAGIIVGTTYTVFFVWLFFFGGLGHPMFGLASFLLIYILADRLRRGLPI